VGGSRAHVNKHTGRGVSGAHGTRWWWGASGGAGANAGVRKHGRACSTGAGRLGGGAALAQAGEAVWVRVSEWSQVHAGRDAPVRMGTEVHKVDGARLS
jgi:hypothetical protein